MLHQLAELGPEALQRIRPHVLETPLEHSPALSRLARAQVYLKLENIQRTGSFKLRGAMNKVLSLAASDRDRGILAASTGNHGLAVAYAVATVGGSCQIYLPRGASPGKVDALRELGANVDFEGTDCEQTERLARELAQERGHIFVSPYNDADVVAGQATVGVEIAGQLDEAPDTMLCSVGGGGLIAGAGGYLKSVGAPTEVVGCWPRNSPALYECLRAGRIIDVPSSPTLSDATAGGVERGAITFDACREVIDESVLVDEREIRDAIRFVLEHHGLVVEGAAGVAVAAFRKTADQHHGKRVVIVLCGRNIELETLRSCLC